MSQIDPNTWRVVSPYLDIALDLDASAQSAWLASFTANHPDLAPIVAELLERNRALSDSGFLEHLQDLTPTIVKTGARVGGYRLLSPLGHGGMGNVWLAERDDGRYEARVAVKFLNAAFVGHIVQERFTREGSVLARLSHPHIARLMDAGVTESEQPYLVLEHVDGEPIDHFCSRHQLSVRDRVRLFQDVLAPVAHAHANLVVHRDLKPSNVMVTSDGRVKLLDFGIAKLLDTGPDGVASTRITEGGGGAMTPAYAAPEQLNGGQITTATDVYALGVLLFELLSGRHPAADALSTPAALMRSITEGEAPRLFAAAAPDRNSRELAGDLEVIVGKALKKAPTERYISVVALSDDLRRSLAHQPIAARGDSVIYRARKFVRRNRTAVALSTVVAAAVIAGIAGTVTQARRATTEAVAAAAERDFAILQLARADAMNDLNQFLLTEAAPSGSSFTVTELLTRAEEAVSRQHADDVATRVEMLVSIGRQYATQDEAAHSKRVLASAYELSHNVTDAATKARAVCALAEAIADNGDAKGANRLVSEGLARLSDRPAHVPPRIFCHLRGSYIARRAARGDEAVAHAEAANRLVPSAAGASPLLQLRVTLDLAESYRTGSRLIEADATFAQVAERLTTLGYERTETAETLFNNWGLVLGELGRARDAEDKYRKAIAISSLDGTDARVSPFVLNNLARTLSDLGRPDEALVYATRAYEKGIAAGNVVITMQSLLARAANHRRRGDLSNAEDVLREIETRAKQVWPEGHPGYSALYLERADLARARGDFSRAQQLFDRVVADLDHSGSLFALSRALLRRANAHLEMKHPERARGDAERALKMFVDAAGPDALSAMIGRANLVMGRTLVALGNEAEARNAFADAIRHLAAYGDEHPDVKMARQLAEKVSAIKD